MTARTVTTLRRVYVPRALLSDEAARRAFVRMHVEGLRHEAAGRRLRVRFRALRNVEVIDNLPMWRVPFIVAARSRVAFEVLAS